LYSVTDGRIANLRSGKYLDLQSNGTTFPSAVIQTCNGSLTQQWQIQ
jgi:hypothetical protein